MRRGLIAVAITLTQTGCFAGALASAGPVFGYVPGEGPSIGWSAGAAPFVDVAAIPITVGQSYRPGQSFTFLDFGLAGAVPVGVVLPAGGVAAGPAWSSSGGGPGLDFTGWVGGNLAGPITDPCKPPTAALSASITLGFRFLFGAPEIFLSPQLGGGFGVLGGCRSFSGVGL
jgi:hypothetical protein